MSLPLPEVEFRSEKRCARELDRLFAEAKAKATGESDEVSRDAGMVRIRISRSAYTEVVESHYCRYRTMIGARMTYHSIDPPPPAPLPR